MSEAPAPAEVQSTAPTLEAAPTPSPATTEAPAAPAPAAPERPAWLPEGFDSPEALAAAYAELKGKPSEPAPEPSADHLPDPKTLNEDDTKFLLAQKGMDVEALSEEYLASGSLSAESYAKLAAQGFPKSFVDDWIAGREAQAEQHRTKLYELVGGEDTFTKVQEWAKVNVPRSVLETYNRAVGTGSIDMMGLAMQGMYARYLAANGQAPTLIGGDSSSAVVEGYADQTAAMAAMRDPKYRTDPSYRAEVERKLAARPVFNARTTR